MKNKKAFTLVEIVVVISVIAVLAAVLIPTFAGILLRAKESARMQVVDNIKKDYFSSSEMSSISEIKDYIIEYENNAYIVGENGQLTDLKTPIQNVEINSGITYVQVDTDIEGAKIYAVLNAGYYTTENTFVPWNVNTLFTVNDQKAVTRKSNSYSNVKSVILPMGIKTIGLNVFSSMTNLESVILPFSVTKIANYAFNASGIKELSIPSSVTEIGSYAFQSCKNLTNLTIPNNVESIGSYAFSSSGIETIVLPNVLNVIPNNLFYYCENLTTVKMPSFCTEIGNSAFSRCTSLTEFTIPEGVKVLNYGVLSSSSNIKTLYLPSTLKSVILDAMYGVSLTEIHMKDISHYLNIHLDETYLINSSTSLYVNNELVTEVNFDENYTMVNNYILRYYKPLKSVTIGNTIKEIGAYAFYWCSNLEEIIFEDDSTLELLNDYSFYGCIGLTSLQIPNSVKLLGYCAFNYVNKALQLTLPNNLEMLCQWSLYTSLSDDNLTIETMENGNKAYYLGSENNDYMVLLKTNIVADGFEINENCKFIYDSTFYNNQILSELTIPDSVIGIGYSAFNKSIISSIDIPSGINYVLQAAFDNMEYLCFYEKDNGYYLGNTTNNFVVLMDTITDDFTTFNIPDTCKVIYDNVFDGISTLTTITLPESVKSIGMRTFRKCTNLTSITFPKKMYQIGYECFYGSTSFNRDLLILPEIMSFSTSKGYNNGQDRGCCFQSTGMISIVVINSSVRAFGYAMFGTISKLFYKGTFDELSSTYVNRGNGNNSNLNPYLNGKIYFYAETIEDMKDESLQYWHYDENNIPTAW